MKKKFTFCFDLDNTICKTKGNDYLNSKPKKECIKLINRLYENGHIIKINTARYMGRNNDNFVKAKKQGYSKTLKQLKKWKCKYHDIITGMSPNPKPHFDLVIDDKAKRIEEL